MLTRNNLMTLAHHHLPADLVGVVEISLGTPQVGPYHCEGDFLDSHLGGVFTELHNAAEGHFHPDVPEFACDMMHRAAETHADLAPQHVLLHDQDKITCMTFVFTDGQKQAISYAAWLTLLDSDSEGAAIRNFDEDALKRFCQKRGIIQISYYQQTAEGTRHHGKVAADLLRQRDDINELVIRGIETHEVAFQFGEKGGVNIPLFDKVFGGWSEDDLAYVFLVNYADQMGSLSQSGQPDIGDFLWMVKSYLAWKQFQELTTRLDSTPRLDGQKLQRAISALRTAPDAFQAEDVDQAYARIVAECNLPTVTDAQVREALATVDGLAPDILEALVADMVRDGKPSSDTGKQLGKLNKPVREALATLG